MKYRILYWLPGEEFKRVYASLVEDKNVTQAILLSNLVSAEGLKIKNIYKYNQLNLREAEKIIDKFKPHIFITCTGRDIFRQFLKQRGIKYGFISHGVWPYSPNNTGKVSNSFWTDIDLACGATNMFKDIFDKYSKTKALVVADTLTQFDILYERMQQQDKIRHNIISKSNNPNASKVITFFGHKCKERVSLVPHNYGYYKTAVELAELAKKNNWLVLIKPKASTVDDFLRKTKHSWATSELKNNYFALPSNKYIQFIPPKDEAYKYFSTDVIICSARSTIEVEAALARKPLIKIWLPTDEVDDNCMSYENGILDFNAAYILNDIHKLEETIFTASENNDELKQNQDKFINHLGITFDGKAHERFLNAIRKVLS